MIELKLYNNKEYASARELHLELGIKDNVNTWFKNNAKRAMLKADLDFIVLKQESTGGRPSFDYLLTENSALSVIAISGGVRARDIRLMLIDAFKQKQSGILLDADQVAALTDMVKAMTLVSVQKKSEAKHYTFFNQPKKWWEYRSNLLGYSTESLKKEMLKINKRYKSQKQALVNLKPSEIIRTGVIDLLIALGKGEEYALNVANFAQIIAEKNGYDKQIWNDTKPNPLDLNHIEIEERKKLL